MITLLSVDKAMKKAHVLLRRSGFHTSTTMRPGRRSMYYWNEVSCTVGKRLRLSNHKAPIDGVRNVAGEIIFETSVAASYVNFAVDKAIKQYKEGR